MVPPHPRRLTDLNLQPFNAMQPFPATLATHPARLFARGSSRRALAAATLCAIAALAAAGAAEAPRKAPLTRYAELWTKSPFTTPPKVIENAPEVNPFEDYALRGIAPLSRGCYLITLVNKKNPTETKTIDTERSSEFEVVKIDRDAEKPLGTVVHLKQGNFSGTVGFDEKLSQLKLPTPPKPGQQPGHQGGAPNPNQPPNNPAAAPPTVAPVTPPRPPRVLPPTAPTTNPATPAAPSGNSRFQPGGGGSSRFQPGGGRSSRGGR